MPSPSFDQFSPPWAPGGLADKECYEVEVSDQWTHSGTHYFVIDRATGTVYFYGVGA